MGRLNVPWSTIKLSKGMLYMCAVLLCNYSVCGVGSTEVISKRSEI